MRVYLQGACVAVIQLESLVEASGMFYSEIQNLILQKKYNFLTLYFSEV